MAKDPAKRFADAEEMLAALDEVPILEAHERTSVSVREQELTTMTVAHIDLRPPSLLARAWSWLRFGRWRWT